MNLQHFLSPSWSPLHWTVYLSTLRSTLLVYLPQFISLITSLFILPLLCYANMLFYTIYNYYLHVLFTTIIIKNVIIILVSFLCYSYSLLVLIICLLPYPAVSGGGPLSFLPLVVAASQLICKYTVLLLLLLLLLLLFLMHHSTGGVGLLALPSSVQHLPNTCQPPTRS